jgi:hypothetical protein
MENHTPASNNQQQRCGLQKLANAGRAPRIMNGFAELPVLRQDDVAAWSHNLAIAAANWLIDNRRQVRK